MFILGCTSCGDIHFYSEDIEVELFATKERAQQKADDLLAEHRGTWHVYSVNKV